jgi:4-hydroxybenzoate polyprenyltransferase
MTSLPDSIRGHWVETLAPAGSRPYLRLARLDRPIGWWLLLLPCWWSTALAGIASGQGPNLWHAVLFLIGAIAMRGAGSTFNDIVDRDLDAQVARTRQRPLPSGQITPKQAVAFMLLQCLIGLAVVMQFNAFTIALSFGSLVIVAIYPFMKRVTNLPQLVLGCAFAWGGLVGWAATFGALSWPAVAIYAAAIAWTVGYDTIYALQDIADDSIVGIKSSARLFGDKARPAIAGLFVVTVALGAAALWGAGAGPLGYLGLLAFATHLGWQVTQLRDVAPPIALKLFRANRTAGLLLAAGLFADGLLRAV